MNDPRAVGRVERRGELADQARHHGGSERSVAV